MIYTLQVICIVLVASGIGIEVGMRAHLGFVLITVGSLSFAVATKIQSLEDRMGRRE